MFSYYVLNDVILNLEEKYRQQLTSVNRIFFSANVTRILEYYNITSFKKNRYDLAHLLKNTLQDDVYLYLVDAIKSNDYDNELILLIYGFLIHKSIEEVLKPYFDSLCGVSEHHSTMRKKHKLERIISYHLRDLFDDLTLEKRKDIFYADDLELNTITDMFSKIYKLSNTKGIYTKAQDDFYNFHHQNINFLFFKRCKYKMIDSFCKSNVSMRSSLRTKLYKKKIDYLNLNKRAWLNPYTNVTETTSFLELYDELIINASNRINAINEVIFYNKPLTKDIIEIKKRDVLNWDIVNPIFKKRTLFKFKKGEY